MTKEQAIERLKIKLDNDKKYLEQCNPFSDLVNEVRLDNKSIEIVLSMLEEKNKEIQFQKDINKTGSDRHKNTKKSLKGIIKKQNRIIDLMSEQLAGLAIFNIDKDETLILSDKEEVKQYYENKAKELINK